jgi:hypothetical protein
MMLSAASGSDPPSAVIDTEVEGHSGEVDTGSVGFSIAEQGIV